MHLQTNIKEFARHEGIIVDIIIVKTVPLLDLFLPTYCQGQYKCTRTMVSACKSPTASKSQQAGLDFAQHDFVLKNTLEPQISNFKIQAQGMSRIVWRISNESYLKI